MAKTVAPVVSGPVTGGRQGRPFGSPELDLEAYGYVEQEFFVEGEATRYSPRAGTQLGPDGHWEVEPVETAPYRTRIVVYRPQEPQACSGTAFVCWNNVSGGHDIMTGLAPSVLESGAVMVGVSAQRVGVHGLTHLDRGLRAWDPDRYGSLSVPGDDYSFDIFTQAATAVGPDRDRTVDPLGGLEVRSLVATGGSQSAHRLAAYINAVHPLERVFDGYLLALYFGFAEPIEVGTQVHNLLDPNAPPSFSDVPVGTTFLRDDLGVPIMIVNSELEAIGCYAVRQPDSEEFRWWEVAGTSHVSEQWVAARDVQSVRDFGTGGNVQLLPGMNRVQLEPVLDIAYQAVSIWAAGGSPPKVQPRLEFEGGQVERDDRGIARGGIRLPQVEVPLATHSAIPVAPDSFASLSGSSIPFSVADIRALYGDEDGYIARFEQAAKAAAASGAIPEQAMGDLLEEARREYGRFTGDIELGDIS